MSYPPNNEGQSDAQSMHQTPAFFLANYRLGKTLGNGSFGKVNTCLICNAETLHTSQLKANLLLICFVACR